MFRNRQKEIEAGIGRYCTEITTAIELLYSAMEQYICQPNREALRTNLKTLHKAESRADDLRAEIEVLMYAKAIFPESRKDIMELLELLDKIPNSADSSARIVLTQYITIPPEFGPEVMNLLDITRKAVTHILEATQTLFHDFTSATVSVGKVDELESEGDRCEAALIESLFASRRDGYEKILLRDLFLHIGKIADRAENVGDLIRILVAKRRI